MGYIIPVLQEKFKTSKIIALHIEKFPRHPGVSSLCSADNIEIEKFLDEHLTDIKNIQIIEWRPSLNFYKESYVKLLSIVVKYLKRADAAERTTAAFGKRWVNNFFKNICNINNTVLYKESSIPVIITGSGPSLQDAVPVIKKSQDFCLIIAASSSASALKHNGIKPDFIIAADGGSWALRHLYRCEIVPLAVNLCAALPSQSFKLPKLIINDGSFWQSIILHELKLPSIIIGQRGTVTATAIELAIILSSGNIFLAGMDLSVNDIRTHVKPYNFDNLFIEKENRFSPLYSQAFNRSFLIRQGGSLDIYASWFKTYLAYDKSAANQNPINQRKIFSLKSGADIFEDGEKLLLSNKGARKDIKSYFKTENYKNDPQVSREKVINALLNALKDKRYSDDLKRELSLLLFPGNKNITVRELETSLKEMPRNGFKSYE